MDQLEKQRELLAQVHHKISEALQRGQMEEVIRLAKAARDFEAALQNLEMTTNRMAAELELNTDTPVGREEGIVETATATEYSNKAWGNVTRREWVHRINSQSKGGLIHHLKGVKYQTDSGRRLGIACARERQQFPFKWFLGLPDERFDFAVLLCQPQSRPQLDFVLPPDFVARVWPSLSHNSGQKKFHVVQSGENYELEPSLGFGPINRYLSKTEVLFAR